MSGRKSIGKIKRRPAVMSHAWRNQVLKVIGQENELIAAGVMYHYWNKGASAGETAKEINKRLAKAVKSQ